MADTQVINVLISSLSKKVPLLKAVKQANPSGKIVGGDSNPLCVGRFFADEFWQMPPLDKLTTKELIDFCKNKSIQAIIPTRDGELLYYAALKEELEHAGIHPMISKKESIEIAQDKLKFFEQLISKKYRAVPTSTRIDELTGPAFVVKEQFGSGSKKIGLNLSREAAIEFANQLEHPIFQPYIEGEEVSVDLYVDRSGKVKGIILRKRELIISGESQITSTFRDINLEKECIDLAEELQFFGHIMFQLIKNQEDGNYDFLECNPRFGGASTLSIAAGLDSFSWFFQEIGGKTITPFKRAEKEKKMVRYPEDMILE